MSNSSNVHIRHIGQEAGPVVCIDDALQGAERLVDMAAGANWNIKSPYYPGIRAAAPQDYADALANVLGGIVQKAFNWRGGQLVATETCFSLVTTPPERLIPIQRAPHFDGVDTSTLAVLHFISPADGSGTAFYRHRKTGFECVDAERFPTYRDVTDKECVTDGDPAAGYFKGSNARFEQTGMMEAKFNRILIYQGHRLHSGYIPDDFAFSSDPRRGRLTVNTFLQYRSA